MDLNKLVEAIDGSTHSLRQSQKVPQGATAPGSADTTKHALRLNNYVKSSIFQNHDTIADRAHATNKAIDQLFSKYYRPTYYPDGDWRNWERMADVDNILKLAQGWFELAKARLAEVVGNRNECDADLIKYLNSQQGSANRTMEMWNVVRDGREASMTDHSSVQQYREKAMKGRNVQRERNIDTQKGDQADEENREKLLSRDREWEKLSEQRKELDVNNSAKEMREPEKAGPQRRCQGSNNAEEENDN